MSSTMTIQLVTETVCGVRCGIGRCNVEIGGASVGAVALKADDDQRITLEENAVAWLRRHGLDARSAETFVCNGLTKWERENR